MDLDRALAATGDTWRESLPPAPDLRESAAHAVAVNQNTSSTARWVSTLVAACLVVGLAGVIAYVSGLAGGGSSRPRQAAATVLVAGKPVPYAGPLSWTDAIINSRHPRKLQVFVNPDHIHDADVCSAVAERAAVVQQTVHTVTILVAGYAPTAGPECPGVAHSLTPVEVHLRQPLSGRSLIDATTGTTHPPLDAARLPRPRDLPAPCQPAISLAWNETTGVITRHTGADDPFQCDVTTVLGTTDQVRKLPSPDGSLAQPVTIAGHNATVWRYDDALNTMTTIQWQPNPGHTIRVTVDARPSLNFSTARSVGIARSTQ